MTRQIEIDDIIMNLKDKSARGIAMHIQALIRAGVITRGARMPPVRDIAFVLGVSPATISSAWADLRRKNIVTGRGRNGTLVNGERAMTQPARFAAAGRYGPTALDLSFAVPDVELLPPLDRALAHGAHAERLNSYLREQIQPDLERILRLRWPYEPQAMLAVNGGYSAVHMVLGALALADAVVAVEDPTPMRHLDILESLGAIIAPVESDHLGPRADALAQVMTRRPAAFLFQPRLNSVTGHHLAPARLAELGDVLALSDTIVIEDDGLGDLAVLPAQSLGTRFADRTVHILSFAKTHGPDLRMAVLSGTNDLVSRVRALRSFNSGWTSRILQSATAWLLSDPATRDIVAQARGTYAVRARQMKDAAGMHGLSHDFGCGLSTWVPVASESYAMITMAAHGIAVMPGSRMTLLKGDHIRMATGIAEADQDRVARILSLAVQAHE